MYHKHLISDTAHILVTYKIGDNHVFILYLSDLMFPQWVLMLDVNIWCLWYVFVACNVCVYWMLMWMLTYVFVGC